MCCEGVAGVGESGGAGSLERHHHPWEPPPGETVTSGCPDQGRVPPLSDHLHRLRHDLPVLELVQGLSLHGHRQGEHEEVHH